MTEYYTAEKSKERMKSIKTYYLIDYENGFILRRPTEYEKFTLSEFVEQRKMRNVFRENEKNI